MARTADTLEPGQKALITQVDPDKIPLKLLEMGCLPGNQIELLYRAPLGDPLFFDVNEGSHLAIRIETAQMIAVQLV
ncbi:MAG: ferrous iron transport protein A [Flavobacterium sp. BFFFF2]|nr:MAG: ferrous iron transport protein A [Flavobacterium sp. BFFFF2]